MVIEVLTGFMSSFVSFLPNIIGAIILLIIGWVVGSLLGKAIRKGLIRYKIDQRFIRKPVFKLSDLFPTLISWVVYLFFIWSAIEFLAIESLMVPFRTIFSFLPMLIGAVIIIVIGYALAEYVRQQVEKSKLTFSGLVGKFLFFLILYVSITLALPLIGIDVSLLNNLLLIVVGSAGVGLAIAIGLGLKDLVAEWAKKYQKKLKK